MDELRGPTIQIILHVQEGLGFGFLRSPFVVSGSLNGYLLETDPVVPCHAPVFDAELVWEADKRRFRSLRVQNVPIKVEVFTTGSLGRKDKVGYLLISLLGAQPKPANKIVDIKHSWHKLLGVKSEGKCCHPQLLMSLSVEDRVHTLTPRNELRMFHSNEVAFLSAETTKDPPPAARSMLLTLNEYMEESKKTASSPNLQPRLLCDEGLIQLGDGKHMFILSLIIGAVDNVDVLLPESESATKDVNCFVSYSVFTHSISTDRVAATVTGDGITAVFNQRTSLRLRSSLAELSQYFNECPHLVTRVCAQDRDIGICSMDLRKLIPTHDLEQFLSQLCNADRALTIHERCFLLRCDDAHSVRGGRRPFVDVEMSLKYIGVKSDTAPKPPLLTARSATQLSSVHSSGVQQLDCKSGSCTHLDQDVGQVAYTNLPYGNTQRYTTASGDPIIQTNEIAELIRKMYDSFTLSQEKLLSHLHSHPATSDVQVQCEDLARVDQGIRSDQGTRNDQGMQYDQGIKNTQENIQGIRDPKEFMDDKLFTNFVAGDKVETNPVKLETSKSDTCIHSQPIPRDTCIHSQPIPRDQQRPIDMVKLVIPAEERDAIMQRFVEELEDWKEKQQELYKCQLKRKEEYHLELLAKEWDKKREELESKLRVGIEQCRHLAADLSRATEEFRLRGYRNTQREKKLLDAKKALEAHYTAKYQELREASQKMEDDMNHQIKLKDMRIEELEVTIQQLEKQVDVLKNNLKNNETEANNKYSGLTKDQTASLIQELRYLEEKLDSAVQSKAFFKEQWGRAVRELHLIKLGTRRQMLTQLQRDRMQLGDIGLDPIPEPGEKQTQSLDLKKLKDDFYVDLLVDSPALEVDSHSVVSRLDGMDMFEDARNTKNPASEKLSALISQRDSLVQQESPDEGVIKQLNLEIRSMLLNCGT